MNYLTQQDLVEKFNVTRQTIWSWRVKNNFPSPYKLIGTRRLYWKPEEVESWVRNNLEVA